MKQKYPFWGMLVLCIFVILVITVASDRAVTTIAQENTGYMGTTIIIDPGHGGIDGGATSCTGILESHINLQIALRLNDLMHLLGIQTAMTRRTDTSIHTSGDTIHAQKVSDLKKRVRIVNNTPNGLLISIHQNKYSDSQYSGAQILYADTNGSKALAENLQNSIQNSIDPDNRRQIKSGKGIYLLDHIEPTGILIECGFLSNPEEEFLLRDPDYQKKLCCVLASVCSETINTPS